MDSKEINFIFFGGEPLAVPILEQLYSSGFIPKLIVCSPDKPVGRKQILTSPPTKNWAVEHNIPFLQPTKLDSDFTLQLSTLNFELAIVVAYGKIIPKNALEIPKFGTINVHPSLLPLYRGPAPITAPILNGDAETGVTIIQLDEKMDHGPILAQESISLNGNEFVNDLTQTLSEIGARLLIATIPKIIVGEISPVEQDHEKATIIKKISKADGEIKLTDDGIVNWRKYRAYFGWPGTFYFDENGKRIIVKEAVFENKVSGKARENALGYGKFIIKKILREGESKIVDS